MEARPGSHIHHAVYRNYRSPHEQVRSCLYAVSVAIHFRYDDLHS